MVRSRSKLAALAAAAVAALAAPAAHAAAPYVPWPSALPPAPTSSNPQPGPLPGCDTPTIACVDAGSARLKKLQARLRCDHRDVFTTTYVEMTHTLRDALSSGRPAFDDAGWIIDIDVLFHDYYFNAFDDYAAGRAVPGAWRVAFRAAGHGNANATKDLLLGVNAHVQRDLPYVLATLGLRKPDGTSRKPDWDAMNIVLDDAYDPIASTISRRFDPSLRLTNPGTVFDGEAALQLFETWREKAWRNAEALLNAQTPQQRAAVSAAIEADTTATARKIAAAPNAPRYRRVRDAYCRTHF
jgi:hypothetical protein